MAAALGELMVEDPPSPHVVNLMLFIQEERAEACDDDKDKQAAQEAAVSVSAVIPFVNIPSTRPTCYLPLNNASSMY